ncbi:MAG: AI-2E family transporter [Thermoleophilaceae bacterium]
MASERERESTAGSDRDGEPAPDGAPRVSGDGGAKPPTPREARYASRSHDRDAPQTLKWAATMSLRFLLIVAALTVIVYGLVRLSAVVLPVLIALLLASLLAPPANWLHRKRVPKLLATAIVVVGALLLVIGLLASIVPAVAAQSDELGQQARAGFQQVTAYLVQGPLGITQAQIDGAVNMAIERLRGSLGGIATGVLTGATIFANVLAQAILTLIVAFFFINDGRRIWGGLVGLLRQSVRDDAHALGKRTFTILKAYSRGIIVVAVADSVLIGLALLAVGVPLTLPIVVLTFLGAFFPLIGAVAAGGVAVLVTLVTNGLTDAIIILVAVLIVQQVEGNLLYPYVVGSSLELHPLLILLALAGGTAVAGVVGALIAVPVTAVASGALSYLSGREPPDTAPVAGG